MMVSKCLKHKNEHWMDSACNLTRGVLQLNSLEGVNCCYTDLTCAVPRPVIVR